MVSYRKDLVKVLARGELKSKLEVVLLTHFQSKAKYNYEKLGSDQL